MVDVFLQAKRNGTAAKRFFKRLILSHQDEPRKIIADKLRSYCVAHRELISETIHSTNYSILVGTLYPLTTTAISGQVRLQNGEGRLLEA